MQNYTENGITANFESKGNCRYQVEVLLTAEATETSRKKALKDVRRNASVPGFRKEGKFPDELLILHFGNAIQQHWREELLNHSIRESLKLAKMALFAQEQVEAPKIEELNEDGTARVTYHFEASPVVPSIELDSIELPTVAEEAISELLVDDEVDEVVESLGVTTEITDRGIEEGDFAIPDIENLDQPGTMICQDKQFKIAPRRISGWCKELITGAHTGDVREATSELDPEANEGVKEVFIPTRCRITVKKILTMQLPELNEETLKVFNAKSRDELRDFVSKRFKAQKARDQRQKLQSHLFQFLRKNVSFEAPHSIIKQTQQKSMRQDPAFRKIEGNEAERAQQVKAIEGKHWESAQEEVHSILLLQKYANDHKITVGNEEVYPSFNEHMMRLRMMYSKEFETLTEKDFIRMFNNERESLILNKAIVQLLEKAKFV